MKFRYVEGSANMRERCNVGYPYCAKHSTSLGYVGDSTVHSGLSHESILIKRLKINKKTETNNIFIL